MHRIACLLILIATILKTSESTTKDLASKQVPVNKCCARNEVVLDNSCTHINESGTTAWSPIFSSEDDNDNNVQVDFRLVIGEPDCGSTQQWPVLHYQRSIDRLKLLPSGKLRHCVYHAVPDENEPLDEELDRCYDYEPGKYCLDKTVSTENNLPSQYALVCTPEIVNDWKNTDFLMKKIVDPVFHGIAIICFLIVAVVYFILPTVRDLVGNIISTICVCMIISQAADMVRIFTELSSHVSFMIADIICYTSLMGAFFWLNSLGYYIWRTFKSRNVFLRVTDGKKYCYYSAYAWTSTILMGIVAVLAHFALEIPKSRTPVTMLHNQEVLGPLGITIYFTPVAFTILVNIFFYATTLQIINRMNTYGRIHHKLKHSFRMFLLVFMIMTITWLFMLLSWLNFDALVHCYILVNAMQAPLFLYVCVFNQKHVLFLLRKSCCYANCICPFCRPEPECEWGDEMSAMNSGIY